MVDRAILLSHPTFQQDNLKMVIKVLLNNDYPIEFIFNTINSRLDYLFMKQKRERIISNNDNSNECTDRKRWFTIPYIHSISNRFKNITKDLDTKISYFSLNKLGSIIRGHKDILPNMSQKNVVYKILCKDCDASYVGQTCRQLKTRISEHKNHIRWNTNTQSVITEHRINNDHDFDWDNVLILDKERFLGKRLISEMLYIKCQDNGLNRQADTEYLHHAYTCILERF